MRSVAQWITNPTVSEAVLPGTERMSDVSDQILRWLVSPDLFHASGAIAAWRSRATGELAFEYPEVTGYLLTCAAYAGQAQRPVVTRAADWLSARVEAGDHSARPGSPVVYAFDLGIIATGLLNVGSALRSDRYLSAGVRLAERLRDEILRSGTLAATSAEPASPTWSNAGRAHLLKCVQCLCLAEEQGAGRMREAAGSFVSSVGEVTLETPDLAFGETGPNLHATCYAAEGLWVWSAVSGDAKAERTADALLAGVEQARLPSGGFPKDLGRNRAVEQSDVTAQVARLGLLLGRKDAERSAALQRLEAIALPTAEGLAIPYQPAATPQHENSWCAMFAFQALRLAASSRPLAWRSLV